MKCRACQHEHPPGMRCEMAQRLRRAAGVTDTDGPATDITAAVTDKRSNAARQRACRQRNATKVREKDAERKRATRAGKEK